MKFVIFDDTDYYPFVEAEYETLKEAKKAFVEHLKYKDSTDQAVYLCKIIEKWTASNG